MRPLVRLLRRRIRVLVLTVVIVPVSALAFSMQQTPMFSASAEVIVGQPGLEGISAGSLNLADSVPASDRSVSVHAEIARLPDVALLAIRSLGLDARHLTSFLDRASVRSRPQSNLLVFAVVDEQRQRAMAFATAYARAYVDYRRRLDTATIVGARKAIEQRIKDLRSDGRGGTALEDQLVAAALELRTIEEIRAGSTTLVRLPERAVQVAPRFLRNAIAGLISGLVLGLALAFLREAFDPRLRSATAISAAVGAPLLGRIATPPRRPRSDLAQLLRDPLAPEAEGYRAVRAALEFAVEEAGARVVAVVGIGRGQGKSTVAANLALACGAAGLRVALIDLDLWVPTAHKLLGVTADAGVEDVLYGRVPLAQALVPIPLGRAGSSGFPGGRLEALLHAPGPQLHHPDLASVPQLVETLRGLSSSFDLVIVDTPAALAVSDVSVIARRVDAAIVVGKLGSVTPAGLGELRRRLADCAVLGVIATAGEREESLSRIDGYDWVGHSYYYAPMHGRG